MAHSGNKLRALNRKYFTAIVEADFNYADAAEVLGVTRQAVSNRVSSHPELKEALAAYKVDWQEDLKDIAEGNIKRALKAGDMKTSRWFLEKLGRDRGFQNAMAVRLDDSAIAEMVDQIANVGGVDALRKLAGEG